MRCELVLYECVELIATLQILNIGDIRWVYEMQVSKDVYALVLSFYVKTLLCLQMCTLLYVEIKSSLVATHT